MTKYLCFLPLTFGLPPWNRDDVHMKVWPLPGWNMLERAIGDADPSHFELRLEVHADSVQSAARQAEELLPMYVAALRRYGPELRDEVSAMPYEDYLEGKPPPNLWRSMR